MRGIRENRRGLEKKELKRDFKDWKNKVKGLVHSIKMNIIANMNYETDTGLNYKICHFYSKEENRLYSGGKRANTFKNA